MEGNGDTLECFRNLESYNGFNRIIRGGAFVDNIGFCSVEFVIKSY